MPLYLERSPARVSGLRRSQFLTMGFLVSAARPVRIREVGLGCSRGSYSAGLRRGEIALARRGVCTFSAAAPGSPSAPAAGALLVISDRAPPFRGTLGGPASRCPVLAVAARGRRSVRAARGRVRVEAITARRTPANVIGEPGRRGPRPRLMAGAHLDSVAEGPG